MKMILAFNQFLDKIIVKNSPRVIDHTMHQHLGVISKIAKTMIRTKILLLMPLRKFLLAK